MRPEVHSQANIWIERKQNSSSKVKEEKQTVLYESEFKGKLILVSMQNMVDGPLICFHNNVHFLLKYNCYIIFYYFQMYNIVI